MVANSGTIRTSDTVTVRFTANVALTQTGVMDISGGTLTIHGHASNLLTELIIGATGFDLGTVVLGQGAATTNRDGKLDLGDGGYAVTMAGISRIDPAGGTTANSAVDFGNAVISLSAAIDGTIFRRGDRCRYY